MGNIEVFAEVCLRKRNRKRSTMRGKSGATFKKMGVRPPEGAVASRFGRLNWDVNRSLGSAARQPNAALQNTQGPRRPTLQE